MNNNNKQLVNYNPMQQHMGTYLSGFGFHIFFSGSFRSPIGVFGATAMLKQYVERLERMIHADVAFDAVLELRHHPGFATGLPSIRPHWHILAASTDLSKLPNIAKHRWAELYGGRLTEAWVDRYGKAEFARIARSLWAKRYGRAQVALFDPAKHAAYYVSKLVGHQNGTFKSGKMNLLQYNGPSDLLAVAQFDPYVPDHLKNKVFGKYLVLREFGATGAADSEQDTDDGFE